MSAVNQEQRLAILKSFDKKMATDSLDDDSDIEIRQKLDSLAQLLATSHDELKQSSNLTGDAPDDAKYVRLSATQEFGLILYWASDWADNPPPWFEPWLHDHLLHEAAFDILKFVLKKYEHYKMSEAEHKALMRWAKTPGLVGNDGTIYGTDQYEQLDNRWMIAALNYVLNLVLNDVVRPFPNPGIEKQELSIKDGASNSEPVLGIIGDWGAGFYQEQGVDGPVPSPAERVIRDVEQQSIDYLMHLGDTYYAGTGGSSRLGPDSANEEQDNLVNVWPDQGEGRNFTLNSNHEMYGAAEGYFVTALGNSNLFRHQKGASVFALTYPLKKDGQPTGKDWLVLGLDSAYFSDDENGIKMYMEGAIGANKFLDEHRVQIKMIEELCSTHSGPIMVMTHHNPCDTITAKVNVLYEQVVKAIGDAPTLWIWGHVHNGIVYDEMIIEDEKQGPVLASPTKSRCCGHGAVPFGPAWGLSRQTNVRYFAHTHDDKFPQNVPRVRNGYALVTLHDDGGFTEQFYEVGSPETPVYQHRWPADAKWR